MFEYSKIEQWVDPSAQQASAHASAVLAFAGPAIKPFQRFVLELTEKFVALHADTASR